MYIRRISAALAAALITAAQPAAAADWLLEALFSETVEVDDNLRLLPDTDGWYIGSTTDLGLELTGRTKRAEFVLSTSVLGTAFTGTGDNSGLNEITPQLGAEVTLDGKRFEWNSEITLDVRSVAFSQSEGISLEDGTIDTSDATTGSALQIVGSGSSTLSLDIGKRNSLEFGVGARVSDFTDGATTLVPTRTYDASAAWMHDLSRRTTTDVEFTTRLFDADSADNAETLSFSLTGGLTYLFSRRLTLETSAGASWLRTERDRTGATGRSSQSSFGGLADLSLTYIGDSSEISFTASQSIDPSSVGVLRSSSALTVSYGQELTNRVGLDMDASYLFQQNVSGFGGGDATRQFFSFSPAITYEIARGWRADLGYRLRISNQTARTALSNNFFLTLSKTFNLMP